MLPIHGGFVATGGAAAERAVNDGKAADVNFADRRDTRNFIAGRATGTTVACG